MNRKIKSVSFNLEDPFENEMYEYSLKFSNFSSFIKRLIQNSINGKIDHSQPTKQVPKAEKIPIVIEQEYLKQLI